MAFNIVVPDLSESVVEATVSEWLKQEGEAVEAGEIVVVLETDKVSLEVTAEQDGVLSKITAAEGEDVGPGAVLGVVEGSSSATSSAVSASVPESAVVPTAATPTEAGDQRATPVAQRMAAEHNVDLQRIEADGKITKHDVRSFIDQQSSQSARSTPPSLKTNGTQPPTAIVGLKEERIRLSRRRQTIAKRLIEAQSTAAMLTTFNEVDMFNVMDVRKRRKEAFKEKYGVGLGFSSFFVKATIGALKRFPYLNAEIQDREIVLKKYYDIGIAIGAEEGLVVPVLRGAGGMSFAEIEQQIREYARQSQEGSLSIESLIGGTFTITNGGVFGSMMSTPILNPPQVGILGLHGIKERPVVVDGEIVIRPMMYLALTYDHRIVDGREAVQFLVTVKELIEDPESLLIEG